MRTDAQVAAWHALDPWRKSLLMAERPDWVESDEVFRLELLADLEREFGPMVHAVPKPDHDWEAWLMPDASEFKDDGGMSLNEVAARIESPSSAWAEPDYQNRLDILSEEGKVWWR